MNSAALFILIVGLVAVCNGQIQYTDWGSWVNALRPGSLYTEGFHNPSAPTPQSAVPNFISTGAGSEGDHFQGTWNAINAVGNTDAINECANTGIWASSDTNNDGLDVAYSQTAPFGRPTAVAGYFASVTSTGCAIDTTLNTAKVVIQTNTTSLYTYHNATITSTPGVYFFGLTGDDEIVEVSIFTVPTGAPAYTYTYQWGQAYTSTYIKQDPHFVGLQGEAYHVMGEPKKWFNIISDYDFQFNAYFESPCEGKWGLSYMTKFAFLVKGWQIMIDTTGHPTINNNIIWINRWGSVPLGVNGTLGAFGRPWENNFWLDTPEWGFTIERHIVDFTIQKPGWMFWGTNCVPAYFNLQAVNEKAKHMNVHGLLGQTSHHKHVETNTGAQGEGEIEGTYKDYEVSGPFGTDFKFNRYTGPTTF